MLNILFAMFEQLFWALNDDTVSVEYSQCNKGVLWTCIVRGRKVVAYSSDNKLLMRGPESLQEWLEPLLQLPTSSPKDIEHKARLLLTRLENWPW